MSQPHNRCSDRQVHSPKKMMTDDDVFKAVLVVMALTTAGAMAVAVASLI